MPNDRNTYVRNMFLQDPALFPEARRQSILDGVVMVGMAPFEAQIAGGQFSYKVVPDPARWPQHADPIEVMWAQSTDPDDSQIWMVFRNASQFSDGSAASFKVVFEHGHAVSIERMRD